MPALPEGKLLLLQQKSNLKIVPILDGDHYSRTRVVLTQAPFEARLQIDVF
jgi:hypothetical protein